MNRLPFLSAILIFLTSAACQGADDGFKHVNAEEGAKLVESGKVTVIDVRTPDEFKSGHIKGAKNIDIAGESFKKQLAELDKAKPYLVHCQAGGRSTRSLKTFKDLGFSNVYHLDGGFSDWEDAGKPVEK